MKNLIRKLVVWIDDNAELLFKVLVTYIILSAILLTLYISIFVNYLFGLFIVVLMLLFGVGIASVYWENIITWARK